jgi:hypothetical protein
MEKAESWSSSKDAIILGLETNLNTTREDYEKLKQKYLTPKERELKIELETEEKNPQIVTSKKKGRKPKVELLEENVINPQCELLTKKKSKTGQEYFTNGIENSNIYDGSGKIIGKYVGGNPIFIKS